MATQDSSSPQSFPYFTELGDDLMAHILAFVAQVPFENIASSYESTLTHVLPVVSKNVGRICSTDFFWKSALERLLLKDPSLWNPGILSLLPQGTTTGLSPSLLLLQVISSHNNCTYKSIFQRLTREYMRYTAPIFHMPCQVKLGVAFGLHLFEPRYRYMISLLMAGHDHSGVPMLDGPTFLYAHKASLSPKAAACIVQILQCRIYEDGSADVFLLPKHYVWLERIWELPRTGGLYEGQCTRMGTELSQAMEM